MNSTKQLPDKYVKGGKINPEYVALWESYLEEGLAAKHVAEVFGVSKQTVLNYYPGKGWTHEQLSAHGTFLKHHNEKMRKLPYGTAIPATQALAA